MGIYVHVFIKMKRAGMITQNELIKRYSTGQVYVSGALINWFGGKIYTFYYCDGKPSDVLKDYFRHKMSIPNNKCLQLLSRTDLDLVIPSEPISTTEERDWIWVEIKLREALKEAIEKKTGRVRFIAMRTE